MYEDEENGTIFDQLMMADLKEYKALRYFEFSIYNDTVEPCMTCEEILSMLRALPNDIKEVCIYTSDECKNISEFVQSEISTKFEYLELGFGQLKLRVEAKHIVEVAKKFPNRIEPVNEQKFKNALVGEIIVGSKADRY